MGRIHARRTCPRCTAANLLQSALASPSQAARRLEPLAEFLQQYYDNPYSLIAFLKGRGGALLRRLAAGEVACSHHGLDQLRQTRSVSHLRTLLVLCGLLEDRNEQLAQAHLRLHQTLAEIPHEGDRIVLGPFLRWYLLPFLHNRTGADGTLSGSVRYVFGQFTTAQGFLDLLREQEASLSDCPQHLVDRWCRDRPWQRGDLKRFLVWAGARAVSRPAGSASPR
ncbi:hypothetical protein [Nonomuraea sp. NPDC050202]|uniref:hypothetical protein n=1 Tax=Nonomuraea sp. NPDC050202 TaxID=3155035 RepID=UPI0033CB66F4